MDLLYILLLLHRHRPPCFAAKEAEAIEATEAILGLPRLGGSAALGAMHAAQVRLQVVPAKDLHLLVHLDLPHLVAALQHPVGAAVLFGHRLCCSPSRHIDSVRPIQG